MNKRIHIKLITSCVLNLALVATSAALAQYVPPPDQKPSPTSSDSGGSRGCYGGGMPLTVLASRKYVGRTISRHPTFAWFVSDSDSFQMKFTIYEWVPNGKPKEVHAMSLQSSPGVMKLSPFKDKPGLEVGKQYFWQVVILCDPDNPSSAIVDAASIEVVGIPPTLASKLNKAINSSEKANIYAEAGLWYNALDEALNVAEASKLGEVGSALLNDLAKWEAQGTTPELTPQQRKQSEKRIENLKQIANSAR